MANVSLQSAEAMQKVQASGLELRKAAEQVTKSSDDLAKMGRGLAEMTD